MNFINFPESNLPLGSGGNENTLPMRVCVCEHPDYKPGTVFYSSKWEFDDEEKYRIKEAIRREYQQAGITLTTFAIDAIMKALPDIWVTVMHLPPPIMITTMPPFYFGYKKMILNRPIDN